MLLLLADICDPSQKGLRQELQVGKAAVNTSLLPLARPLSYALPLQFRPEAKHPSLSRS